MGYDKLKVRSFRVLSRALSFSAVIAIEKHSMVSLFLEVASCS